MTCPHCGSENVRVETFQEQSGTTTVTKTKSKYKQVKHGLLWWFFIGWWWWIIDLFLWVTMFPFRLAYGLLRKKKYKGKETSTSTSTNHIEYKQICTCENCGHVWSYRF